MWGGLRLQGRAFGPQKFPSRDVDSVPGVGASACGRSQAGAGVSACLSFDPGEVNSQPFETRKLLHFSSKLHSLLRRKE